jgi:hypothetical protein
VDYEMSKNTGLGNIKQKLVESCGIWKGFFGESVIIEKFFVIYNSLNCY